MSDYENVNTSPDYENVNVDYIPTTEEMRERFILGALRRRDLDKEVADWDAWLASVRAEAWDEGWDRGLEDSSRPERTVFVVNPYREVSK